MSKTKFPSGITTEGAVISNVGTPVASTDASTKGYTDTGLGTKANDNAVIKKDGSVAFTADQSLGSNKLTNVADGVAANDVVNKGQLDTKANDSAVIKHDGSVAFTADQSMGGFSLTNLADGVALTDAVTKQQLDTKANDNAVIKKDGSVAFTADQSMGSHKLTGLSNGTVGSDAVNKDQLDTKIDSTAAIHTDGTVAFTASQSLGGNSLTNVADGVALTDAVTKQQLDTKADESVVIKHNGSVAFTGDQSMGSHKLTNLATPTTNTDAATKAYADGVVTGYVKADGTVSMTGSLNMNSHTINNVTTPSATTDAANKDYVDTLDSNNIKKNGSVAFTADQSMGGFSLQDVAYPLLSTDAATKIYVDEKSPNYIAQNNGDIATGYTVYKDAAQVIPEDGTGGSPSITFGTSFVSPLRGSASFLLTKGVGNKQGEGASYDFTIDAADKGRVLAITFDYNVTDNYVDNDVRAYIYDVTNSRLIEPAPSYIKKAGSSIISQTQPLEFQTSIDSTSYRLIFHIAGTTSPAWELRLDNIKVAPNKNGSGVFISDFQSYTPTFSASFGTTTLNYANWRRVGDHIEIEGSFVTGTVTTGTATVSLPTGIVGATRSATIWRGDWRQAGASADDFTSGTFQVTSGATSLNFADDFSVAASSGSPSSAANANIIFRSASTVSFNISLNVVGWSSNMALSSNADTRVVGFSIARSAAATSLFTSGTVIKQTYDVAPLIDTHGGWDSTNNRYIARVAGLYRIFGKIAMSASAAAFNPRAHIKVNGSDVTQDVSPKSGTTSQSVYPETDTIVSLNAGDYVELFGYQDSGSTLNSNGTATVLANRLTIERLSGPQQIAASETIAARYTTAAGQSIPNATSTIVDFGTKDIDTHGAVTTGASWKFTAQTAGIYQVSAKVELQTGGGWGSTEEVSLAIRKNGTTYTYLGREMQHAAHTTRAGTNGSTIISLNAGDYISIAINQDSGAAVSMEANSFANHVSIIRIGL